MDCNNVIERMRALADPAGLAGQTRFGISIENRLGLRMPQIRQLAKEIGHDHGLALALWQTGIDDARILAPLIADPKLTDDALMQNWAADFASWDVCDQCCINLFRHHPDAFDKVAQWAAREEEFHRRAAFTLLATLAVHRKKTPDQVFVAFFPLIEHYAFDDRNFVKKAVNWALRQTGKRNKHLNALAIEASRRIVAQGTAPARWIGNDALRELQDSKILKRLKS